MGPAIDLLVIGDAMIDITIRSPKFEFGGALPSRIRVSPGGLANVAVAARRAGARTGFLGRIGQDPFGDRYEEDLGNNGVLSYVLRCDQPTGLCVNLVPPGGERTMYTSRGANDLLASQDVAEEIISSTRMIFVSGFAMETSRSAGALEQICHRASAAGKSIAIGGGAHNLIARRPVRFARLIRCYADYLILNEDEARAVTRRRRTAGILRSLAEMTDFFVVTRGAEGSHCYFDGVFKDYSCPRFEATDTTGSGDVFAGVLLAGILEGAKADEAIIKAHQRASTSVRRIGPRT